MARWVSDIRSTIFSVKNHTINKWDQKNSDLLIWMTSCRPWTFISGTYCILSEICHTDSLFHFAVLDSLVDRFLSRELKESAWAKKCYALIFS